MPRHVLAACLLLALPASLPLGCRDKTESGKVTPSSIEVFVDEAPRDPKNLNKVRIATITVGDGGRLDLAVEKEVPPASDRLRKAVAEIGVRKALRLTGEVRTQVDGREVRAVEDSEVLPGDPRYPYAVANALQAEFGLDARVP